MMNTSAEAFAPATVANMGVGFDILGLALCEPGDIVRVEHRDQPGAVIVKIQGDGGKLPYDPLKNTACVAANSVLTRLDARSGVEITIQKNLSLASGMGSSAASAVAAAVAVNKLFGEPLTRNELLSACLDGEAAVSGRHADNVAPSLFGGITLITGTLAEDIRQLPIPDLLYLALVTPNVAVPTALARSVLPAAVPFKSMVAQTAAVASLIDALYRQDVQALAEAMEQDNIIEPARIHLMPNLVEMRNVAKQTGAWGLVISGAGPTLCAICDDKMVAASVSEALHAAYLTFGIDNVSRVTQVSAQGAIAR